MITHNVVNVITGELLFSLQVKPLKLQIHNATFDHMLQHLVCLFYWFYD